MPDSTYDPNKFGRHYKKHLWVRAVRDMLPVMVCERDRCNVVWEPQMSRSQIRWCKGVGA